MKRKIFTVLINYRREVGAVTLALCTVIVLANFGGHQPPSHTIVVAAHPLKIGEAVSASDLTTRQIPTSLTWSTAITALAEVDDRRLIRTVAAGQPLSESDFAGKSLLSGLSAIYQAVGIPITSPATATPVSSGDRVDVYATSHQWDRSAVLVAHNALVLVPATHNSSGISGGEDNSLPLIVAVTSDQARAIAQQTGGSSFSLAILP